MYKQINTQAGKNISDSQPIKTYSKMFQSPKLFWKFDACIMMSFIFIGLGVFAFSGGSAYYIAGNMQVWSCLKRSDLWRRCFHWEFFLVSLGMPNIFDNFVKLIQIKKCLENEFFSVYLPFMAAGWKNLKNIWKCARPIFRMSLLFTLSKSFYLTTGHQKSI